MGILQILPEFFVIIVLAFLVFQAFYAIARLLRLPDRWVMVCIGILLFLFSLARIVPPLINQPDQIRQNLAVIGAMLGLVAVVSALYAFGQWAARGWYLLIKRRTRSFLGGLARNILLFLRARHQFLGWGVIATATAHVLFYIPLLAGMSLQKALTQPAVLTGIVAWVVLACLVGCGLWIESAIKRKRIAQRTRLLHIVTAFFFFLFTLLHIGTKLMR